MRSSAAPGQPQQPRHRAHVRGDAGRGQGTAAHRRRGSAVRVVFKRQETARPFREFIAEEGKAGRTLDVDHLLVLRYLLSHPEIDTSTAAELCQRRDAEMRDILDEMVQIYDYLERGGAGRGTWWR
jgi:ATP-dependent DNA helicase RecG